MDGWRREFDWMRYSKAVVVLPIIALVVTGLVLAAYVLSSLNNNFLNSKTIPDDEDERHKSRRRRHHHQHYHGKNNNYKRHIGGSTRRRKSSSRDIPTENRLFLTQQQDRSSYSYIQFSGVRQFLSAVKQFLSYPMSTISFLSPWHEHESSTHHQQHHHHKAWHSSTQSSMLQIPSSHTSTYIMENYYHDAIVVGLDCEMVGGGRGGWKSLLARCSVVTLDSVATENYKSSSYYDQIITSMKASTNTNSQPQAIGQQHTNNLNCRLNENLIVLYDKYVIPKGKITDYRTEWSGITKDTYSSQSSSSQQSSPIPIVSFHQCQNEITQLFSSIHGRRVVVVGHALENDFEALEINVRRDPYILLLLIDHCFDTNILKSLVLSCKYNILCVASSITFARYGVFQTLHERIEDEDVSEEIISANQRRAGDRNPAEYAGRIC